MRATCLVSALAVLVLAACGGNGSGPAISGDADSGKPTGDIADTGTEVCKPSCNGKQCGPDGCGGSCGECAAVVELCTEAGQCVRFTCKSTKDCPGDLVCETGEGECVVCVGDEDCAEGLTCGADYECHSAHTCTSDKDCKDLGMLCDKEAGVCVECFESKECLPEEFCLEKYCVPDVCTAGGPHCDGLDVLTCQEDGGGEVVVETCKGLDYCEDGACHEPVCKPAAAWCDGDVLKVCSADGKSVESETDCGALDELCVVDECMACACVPGAKTCLDGSTLGECAGNCMDEVQTPCAAKQSCQGGECVAWLCDPGTVFCVGEVYKVCSGNGLAIQYEEDCGAKGQHCFGGACIDTVCVPDQVYCQGDTAVATCDPDGMSFDTEACPAQHYCLADESGAECLPWVCTPEAVFCEDNTAKVCNGNGSGLSNQVPCGNNVCVGGVCKAVICQPDTSYCEGNTVMQCDATGTVLQVVKTCGLGQYCGEDGNAAACADQICTPNAKSCQGTTVMQCDDVGAALTPVMDCKDEKKGCSAGVCVEQVCGNGLPDPGEQCDDGNSDLCDGCEGCESRFFARFQAGLKSYVEVTDVAGKPLALTGTPFTVEFWVRLDTASDWMRIFHRGNANKGWAIAATADSVGIAVFNSLNQSAPAALVGTGWRHVAWTFGGGQSTLWVDGQVAGSQSTSVSVLATTTQTMIGAHTGDNGEFKNYANARADEVRVSNVVRYSSPFTPARRHQPDANTLGLWHLDEGIGQQVVDSSGYEHPGMPHSIQWEPDGCYGSPADSAVCGDDKQAVWEACDDGNAKDGDGCSGQCTLEASGADCAAILQQNPGAPSGKYEIDPDGTGTGLQPFPVYCDMTTEGGGWTVVYAATGADGEVPMVSNSPVMGNPLVFEHFNIGRSEKMALSLLSSESLFVRQGGTWLKVSHSLFDQQLDTPDSHQHHPVSITASGGGSAQGWIGYSNFNNSGGGDYNVSMTDGPTCAGTTQLGVDHHNVTYYHLNCGCKRQYLYSYSNGSYDGDGAYHVNDSLGSWAATSTCVPLKEVGTLKFYAAMR